MGLPERRALRDFQENQLPNLERQVKQAAGFEVPLTILWDTLMVEDSGHLYNESWPKVYFEPLIAALKDITRDELGREALQEKLKEIVLRNTAKIYYGDRWASLQNGVLTLDHESTTNVDNIKERTDGLITVLEKAL